MLISILLVLRPRLWMVRVAVEKDHRRDRRKQLVDKNHGWTEGHGDHVHARPQRELGALMPRLGDLGRNVVDRDDAVEQHDHHKKQQTERDIVQ